MLRNYLIIIIIPALLAWVLANKWPRRGLAIFGIVYTLFIILFFTARYIDPKLNFPQAVVTKQHEFMKLTGGSNVPMKELEPTVGSFIKNIPQAITLSAVRPYPSDVKHILSLAAAAEINALLLVFLLFLIFRTNSIQSKNFVYFCLFFSFSILITIGYTVNFLGAIVRYRSIVIPLLVVPMAALTNWKKIGDLFFNNIKLKNNIQNSSK